MRFWYHMYRYQPGYLGKLNVWLYNMRTGQFSLYWTLQYSQADEWRQGKISYKNTDKHQIIFEGLTGTGRGDFAIDDISFRFLTCDLFPDYASPNETVTTTTKQPVFTTQTKLTTTYSFASQSAYDCNFDNGICASWSNDANADFSWAVTNRSLTQNNGNFEVNCFILYVLELPLILKNLNRPEMRSHLGKCHWLLCLS
jgi:hypothetical protein